MVTAAQARARLTLLIGLLAALLLPSVAGVSADGAAALTLTLVACALVTLMRDAHLPGLCAVRSATAGPVGRRTPPPDAPARATDPTHHPLRPRAPGAR